MLRTVLRKVLYSLRARLSAYSHPMRTLLLCLGLSACGDVSYLGALEHCRAQSATCDEYVMCRARVADAAARPFSGLCADGGAR